MRKAWLVMAMMLVLPAVAVARGGPAGGGRGGPAMQGGGFGMGPGGPMGAWWNSPQAQKQLGLTADQVKKLQDGFKEHRTKMVDLRASLEKLEIELRDLLDSDPPDGGKIQAATDAVIAARGRLQKEFMNVMLKARLILTKDQWLQMRELRHRGGRGRGMGRGMGGGMGPERGVPDLDATGPGGDEPPLAD